jgi:hypothetical protein
LKEKLIDSLCEARKCVEHYNTKHSDRKMRGTSEKSAPHVPSISFNPNGYAVSDFCANNRHVIFKCASSRTTKFHLNSLAKDPIGATKRKAAVLIQGEEQVSMQESESLFDDIFGQNNS